MKRREGRTGKGNRKVSWMRKVALLLAIVLFSESIPAGQLRAKAAITVGWQTHTAQIEYITAAAYGDGRYVAIDEQGIVYISADALEWEQAAEINTEQYGSVYNYRLKWLNGAFYLYGATGLFLVSADGTQWEELSLGIDGSRTVSDITYNGGTYYAATGMTDYESAELAVSEEAALYKSEDGSYFMPIQKHAPTQGATFLAAGADRLVIADVVEQKLYTCDTEGKLLSTFEIERGYQSYSEQVGLVYMNGYYAAIVNGAFYASVDAVKWEKLSKEGSFRLTRSQGVLLLGGSLYYVSGYDGLCQIDLTEEEGLRWNSFPASGMPSISAIAGDEKQLAAFAYQKTFTRALTGEPDPSQWGTTVLEADHTISGESRMEGIYNLSGHTLTIEGDATLSDAWIRANGGKLVITGDCTVLGSVYMSGQIEVEGSLTVLGTCLSFEEAQLTVGGDVTVGGEDYAYCYGLRMTHEADKLTVGGDLTVAAPLAQSLTAGEILALGDVTLGSTYRAQQGHSLVLGGTKQQQLETEVLTRIGTLVCANASGKEIKFSDRLERDKNELCMKIEYKTDIGAPTAPEDLTVVRRTGNSVFLEWSPSYDDSAVSGYRIYRNGTLIEKECKDTAYQDKKAAANEASYYVTAYDPFDNESEKSNTVSASTSIPVFTQILPQEGAVLGQSVTLSAKLTGLYPSGVGTLGVFWYDAGSGQRKEISTGQMHGLNDQSDRSVDWDLSGFTQEQDLNVTFVVTDYSGYQVEKTVKYHLDRTAPKLPESFTAKDQDRKVLLGWTRSGSDDVSVYRLYRRKQGETGKESAALRVAFFLQIVRRM